MAVSSLQPILTKGSDVDRLQWESSIRPHLRQQWLDLLGQPSFHMGDYPSQSRLIDQLHGTDYQAQWWQQPTGPKTNQKVVLLIPNGVDEAKASVPGVVVPCYHPERVSGVVCDIQKQSLQWEQPATPPAEGPLWGVQLVQQGFFVACVEAFPFNTVLRPQDMVSPLDWWKAGAAKILTDNPSWTGLGKLVHDTSRGLDLLLEQAQVDPHRIAMVGHSLGGKRTMYTAALDERVACAIGSDFGLPWRSTNWNAPWYLGEHMPADDSGLAHHQLLALMAPRPFFLIAGETDTQASFDYLEAARPVYALYGRADAISGYNHATGHEPNTESLDRAYRWLRSELQ